MQIKQQLISSSRYKYKSPYTMKPKGLTIHNTANDASAKSEIAYMIRNNNYTSYHIAVDDIEAIQAIPFNRNAFHAGDGGRGDGNRNHIGLEICYSKSGGPKFDKAEENAAKVSAQILKQFGWTISNIKRHKDHSGKNCPHRTMAKGWDRFLNMVRNEMSGTSKTSSRSKSYMQVGDSGSNVKKLQEDLIKLGGYTLDVNGKYDALTRDRVFIFQSRNFLEEDGVAGEATLAKLEEVLNRTYFDRGDKGEDVRRLQRKLISLGGYSLEANGKYDSNTKDKFTIFQRRNNLKDDGIAGKETIAKLNQLLEEKKTEVKEEVMEKDKLYYRVKEVTDYKQVGAFEDKANAEKKLEKLEKEGKKGWIDRK